MYVCMHACMCVYIYRVYVRTIYTKCSGPCSIQCTPTMFRQFCRVRHNVHISRHPQTLNLQSKTQAQTVNPIIAAHQVLFGTAPLLEA